ncbi:disease resistance RPP13-like protein 4 [Cryptomeria japonica]|uniref:disease resistance RPP13-like protein 4 n=1 Tax=Cryptomeria japonica TaxID=3369 RepID=UPI0027DA3D17|nr:disease resistance RPP13-like protein 4 [Cryptomeria japonica]
MAGCLVSVLADHLTSVLIGKIFEEISLASRHREDLELICDELESIKCLLNDAGGVWRTNSNSVRNWLQKLEDFLYEALHLLEDSSQPQHHTTCISRYLLGRKIRVLKERIRCIHRSSKYLKYLRNMDVKPRAALLTGESIRNRRKSSGLLLEATTVGMQNDIDLISGWLLTDGPQIIAVAGMGGLGKTLLLQHVFNSQKIRESFDHLIWVAVSQSFVVHQLLLYIARQINLPEDQKQSHLNVEEVRDNIRRHLHGSRCLLVLDDVWDKHALGSIGFPLEGRSRAMLSTRDRKVLENVGAHRIHHMDYLSEENSWRLFCIHAFPEDHNQSPPEELEKVARAIERKCSRLPLAVKTVAASIASVKQLPNEWESTLNRLNKISTIKDDIRPILRLSYDALPAYLKPCFLFCSAYPEDAIMSCKYLVLAWIAQGFVNPEEREDSYELGFSYLNELVDRCMIEFVPYDGNDYIIKISKPNQMFDPGWKKCGEVPRRKVPWPT